MDPTMHGMNNFSFSVVMEAFWIFWEAVVVCAIAYDSAPSLKRLNLSNLAGLAVSSATLKLTLFSQVEFLLVCSA